eukprot:753404-Hanusia_phi.AAC.5
MKARKESKEGGRKRGREIGRVEYDGNRRDLKQCREAMQRRNAYLEAEHVTHAWRDNRFTSRSVGE